MRRLWRLRSGSLFWNKSRLVLFFCSHMIYTEFDDRQQQREPVIFHRLPFVSTYYQMFVMSGYYLITFSPPI